MKRIVLMLALLFQAGISCSQTGRIVNSVDAFEAFVSAAKGNSFDEQEIMWRGFEARYADIYERIVFPHSRPDWEQRRLARLRVSFASLPHNASTIIAFMRQADDIVTDQLTKFRSEFPDMQSGTPLIFLPVSTFNIAAQPTSYGAHSLVVGVDFILENHDVLDSLFAHEFFHVYQFGKLDGKPLGTTMASPLWLEGLATYVSARLNPTVPAEKIFMSAPLAAACTPANVAEWARDYLKIVHRDASAAELQTTWFRVVTPEPLPRRGYCLGYHVAQRLAAGATMTQMASWDETIFQSKIEGALKALARRENTVLEISPP